VSNPKQIDKSGVWVVNLSEYRFPHGTREGVVFEPKQPTRVDMDDWIKGQEPILQQVEDPFGQMPESPVVQETPLKNHETGKPVTGVGTGPKGSGNGDEVRANKGK
jgi:hypothetical protein